jgi:hypothetical protein
MTRGELSNLFERKLIGCLTWLGYDNGKPCPTVIFMCFPTDTNIRIQADEPQNS